MIFISIRKQSEIILTNWDPVRMTVISRTTFSNAFPSMEMFVFRLRFHWILFPRVQFAIISSDIGLAPNGRQAIIWTNVHGLFRHICMTRPQWVNSSFIWPCNISYLHANATMPKLCISSLTRIHLSNQEHSSGSIGYFILLAITVATILAPYQSSLYDSFEQWASVDEIYGCPISLCVAGTWLIGTAHLKQHSF